MNDGFESAAAMRQLGARPSRFLEPLMNLELPVIPRCTGRPSARLLARAGLRLVLATSEARFLRGVRRIGVVRTWGDAHLAAQWSVCSAPRRSATTRRVIEPEEAKTLGLVFAIVPEPS